jgi:hypothetical protein
MKYLILFCAGLFLSALSYAQQVRVNPNGNTNGNKLKVTLLKDNLFVTDKDQAVPVASLSALDSLIKKLPDPQHLTIHFETENAEPEKIRAVTAVLNKCRCHVTRHSISVNKY